MSEAAKTPKSADEAAVKVVPLGIVMAVPDATVIVTGLVKITRVVEEISDSPGTKTPPCTKLAMFPGVTTNPKSGS